MSKNYFIDYENVCEGGLDGYFGLAPQDVVYLFYTEKNNKIRIDFFEKFLSGTDYAVIRFLKVASGNQALDMQLSTFLGSVVAPSTDPDEEFIVVSNDKGYGNIISFWQNQKPGIRLYQQNKIAPPKPAVKKPAAETDTDTEEVNAPQESASDNAIPAGTVSPEEPKGLSPAGRSGNRRNNGTGRKTRSTKKESKSAPAAEQAADQRQQPQQDQQDQQPRQDQQAPRLPGDKQTPEQENGKTAAPAPQQETPAPSVPSETGNNDRPMSGKDRHELNDQIQKVLSKEHFDTKIVCFTASQAVKACRTEHPKKTLYQALIKEYGQKQGNDVYKQIRNLL